MSPVPGMSRRMRFPGNSVPVMPGQKSLQKPPPVRNLRLQKNIRRVTGTIFVSLTLKEKVTNDEYDFTKHGTLVSGELPEGYELLDQYWIEEGRTLVYIALNKKTNQTEYLLFEPPLSEFEYELLERLHQDLIDVLILTSDELKRIAKGSCSQRCTASWTITASCSTRFPFSSSSITFSGTSSAGRVSIPL